MEGIKEFQFLLVRLKAHKSSAEYGKYHISIPTGTIKRILDYKVRGFINPFQFLLVRLKEHIIPLQLFDVVNFNSYWYD